MCAVATVGALLIGLSIRRFMLNVVLSLRRKGRAGADPWDGRTLEWAIPSPPPAYNFAEIPTVHARDDFWHQKYVEDETGRAVPIEGGGVQKPEEEHAEGEGHGIHMPSPSFFPLIAAIGLPIIATGLIYDAAIVAVGVAVLVVGIYGWALEPASE